MLNVVVLNGGRGAAALNVNDIERVLSFDTALARFAIECNSRAQEAYFEQTGEHGISLPDPVAMAVALEQEMIAKARDLIVPVLGADKFQKLSDKIFALETVKNVTELRKNGCAYC